MKSKLYVEIKGELKHFNISQVLPDRHDVHDDELVRIKETFEQFKSKNPPGIFVTEVLKPGDTRSSLPQFDVARAKELEGLARRGVYEIVLKDEVPEGANILGSRFVLSIKNKDTGDEVYKARFVVQGHKDREKDFLVHISSNLKQSSIRLVLSLAAIFGFNIWSQDITQAYIQSSEKLMRHIYIKPSKELRLSKDYLLKLLKPLYGLSDSGDSWYSTFTSHLKDDLYDLCMSSCITDPALFFKTIDGQLRGVVGCYVDDTISTGDSDFQKESLLTGEKFESKPREEKNFKFAGMEIETISDSRFKIHQQSFAEQLTNLPNTATFSDFRSKRHQLAWLGHTRPDLACAVNLAAQVTENTYSSQDILALNKIISAATRHSSRGIIQQKLDTNSLRLVVYTDAAFATNKDYSSQLGYLILLADKQNRCNILHYCSYKSRRVARSVLGSEF